MSTTKVQLLNPQGIAKSWGYSHVAVVERGRTVYIAGQVALDEQGELVGANDVRAQAERVFANLNAAVIAAGGHVSRHREADLLPDRHGGSARDA